VRAFLFLLCSIESWLSQVRDGISHNTPVRQVLNGVPWRQCAFA
jgi:hypothetical protein